MVGVVVVVVVVSGVRVEVVVGSDGVQGGGGCGVGSGQAGRPTYERCCCGGVSWRERKAHFGWGQQGQVISSSTSTTLY